MQAPIDLIARVQNAAMTTIGYSCPPDAVMIGALIARIGTVVRKSNCRVGAETTF